MVVVMCLSRRALRLARGAQAAEANFIGSGSPGGHSAISQVSDRSSLRCAGRTRWNTKFELSGTGRPSRRRDPSRQVIGRAAAGPAI